MSGSYRDLRVVKNDYCIWSPNILREIVSRVPLLRQEISAQFDLYCIDAAKKREIPFGVDMPPVNFSEPVDDLLGVPSKPKPIFYVSSEMANKRIGISRKATNMSNSVKLQLAKGTKLCKSSQRRVDTLMSEIRAVLNAHYRKELESKMDLAKSQVNVDQSILRLIEGLVNEIKTDDKNLLVDDAVLITPPDTVPTLKSVSLKRKQNANGSLSSGCPDESTRCPDGSTRVPVPNLGLTAKQQRLSEEITSITVEELKDILSVQAGERSRRDQSSV